MGNEYGKSKVPSELILKDPSQVNTEKGSSRIVLMIDSNSLANLDAEEMQAAKTASYIMTDANFSLQAYVAQIETLIEQDKTNS